MTIVVFKALYHFVSSLLLLDGLPIRDILNHGFGSNLPTCPLHILAFSSLIVEYIIRVLKLESFIFLKLPFVSWNISLLASNGDSVQ